MMKAGFFSQGGITLVGHASQYDVAGDFSLDISGIDTASGDIGILFYVSDDDDASHTVSPTMTELYKYEANDSNPASAVWVRTMDGTETTVSTSGMGSADDTSIIFAVFRGCSEPVAIATAHGSPGNPNPPSVSTSAGDAVVAMGGVEDEEITFTAPADYVLIATIAGGGATTASSAGMAWRTDPSVPTEDPGEFGGADDAWDAHTIVLEAA